jgi:hypothetical protein
MSNVRGLAAFDHPQLRLAAWRLDGSTLSIWRRGGTVEDVVIDIA